MKVYKFSHSFLVAILTAVLCISGNVFAYSGGLSWQLVFNMITARDQFAGCVIGDKIYVFGGNGNPDGNNLSSGEVYNINTSSWSSIASNTSEGIEELSGVGLDGKFYVFGGCGYYGVINFNEVYNPATNTWTTLAQKPTITSRSTPAVYNGKIYLFGGDYVYEDDNGNEIFYQAYPNVEAYDPATNTWQSKTPMPKLLMNPAVAVYGNSAYIIGGYDIDSSAINTEVMVYNFTSNTWTRNYCIAPTEAARVYSYASITHVIDGKAYLIGGIESSFASSWSSDKFTIFDISAKTWESQASLPEARDGHLVVVHNETPYVIGGYNDGNDFNRAESSVYAFLKPDNFNDNSMDTSLWHLYQLDPTVWADETNQRLELRSTGDGREGAAGYFANGWGFSPTNDFSLKIDFHFFSLPSGPADTDAAVQFTLNNGWDNDIIIETGCGSNEEGTAYHSFFYCAIENRKDGSEDFKGEKERYTDNGTLYISYDASEDKLYLSDTGYWAANAWITVPNLINGTWAGNVLFPSFGGWSESVVLGSGDAYLDNFVVDSGTIVPICEYPLAGDLNNDCKTDFEDLAILADQWLQTPSVPSADIAPSPNGDGIVNFQDFAAMVKDWLAEDEISDHVFEIELQTGNVYSNPDLSDGTDLTFELNIDVTTDAMVEKIEFLTPAGNTFEITNSDYTYTETSDGWFETNYRYDVDSGMYIWFFGVEAASFDAYGDGNYIFTIYYANGSHYHTTVWFGVPGTTYPVAQPNQKPVFTSFSNGDVLESPITFTWETCTDIFVNTIGFDLINCDTDEELLSYHPLPVDTTGLGESFEVGVGCWEAELVFATHYVSQNSDGIIVKVEKNIESDYEITVGEAATPPDIVWISINDSGAGMKDEYGNPISQGGFIGEMSKYETTNAQYCQFLNAALASGDITVGVDNIVYGASGSDSGADFVDTIYFYTYAAEPNSQITYFGGVFSVRSRDGYDMSNHPVVMVNWYGSTAFANYYGYRLPTEWEWQAVADYDGSYIYGCGTTIDQSKANYPDGAFANPLGLTSYPYTTPVDYYPSYGYGMNDMAGNVVEWTSSLLVWDPWDPTYDYRVPRGGSWNGYGVYLCTVSYSPNCSPNDTYNFIGFRVCR